MKGDRKYVTSIICRINESSEPLVRVTKGEKPLSIAVDELYHGELQIISEDDEEQEEEA